MKTNQERATIIMNHYAASCDVATPPAAPRFRRWQVVTAAVCAGLLLFASVALLVGLLWRTPGRTPSQTGYSFDQLYIADYQNYDAIGLGSLTADDAVTTPHALNAASLSATSNRPHKKYLIGKTKDGRVKKLDFTATKDGPAAKTQDEQSGNITKVYSFTNFTFFQWGGYDPGEGLLQYAVNGVRESVIYVIDHRSGKIFALWDTGIADIIWRYASKYGDYTLESDDYLYFIARSRASANGDNSAFWRLSIVDETLRCEKVIDQDQLAFNVNQTFVDRYGNLYLADKNYDSPKYRLISPNNTIKLLSTSIRLATNRVVYTYDKTQKVDATGNLVANTFTDVNLFYLAPENRVKTVGNVDYYYGMYQTNGGGYYPDLELDQHYSSARQRNIIAVTWLDAQHEQFTYAIVPPTLFTSSAEVPQDYVATNDYIYFRDGDKIFSVTITDGTKQDLSTGYLFNSIYTDNLGNVVFEALDKNMNNIKGTIDNNGDIDITQNARNYEIYSLKPIN